MHEERNVPGIICGDSNGTMVETGSGWHIVGSRIGVVQNKKVALWSSSSR